MPRIAPPGKEVCGFPRSTSPLHWDAVTKHAEKADENLELSVTTVCVRARVRVGEEKYFYIVFFFFSDDQILELMKCQFPGNLCYVP